MLAPNERQNILWSTLLKAVLAQLVQLPRALLQEVQNRLKVPLQEKFHRGILRESENFERLLATTRQILVLNTQQIVKDVKTTV